jgi:hypothetical protein
MPTYLAFLHGNQLHISPCTLLFPFLPHRAPFNGLGSSGMWHPVQAISMLGRLYLVCYLYIWGTLFWPFAMCDCRTLHLAIWALWWPFSQLNFLHDDIGLTCYILQNTFISIVFSQSFPNHDIPFNLVSDRQYLSWSTGVVSVIYLSL